MNFLKDKPFDAAGPEVLFDWTLSSAAWSFKEMAPRALDDAIFEGRRL